MQRITIARFDVVRTANIVAALYAVIVLVIVLLFAVPFAFVALVAGQEAGGPGVVAGGVVGGLLVLLLAVVFYGGIGWVMTALVCALYNALAGRIGGIRVEVQPEGPALDGTRRSRLACARPHRARARLRRPSPVARRSRRRMGSPGLSVSGTAW